MPDKEDRCVADLVDTTIVLLDHMIVNRIKDGINAGVPGELLAEAEDDQVDHHDLLMR